MDPDVCSVVDVTRLVTLQEDRGVKEMVDSKEETSTFCPELGAALSLSGMVTGMPLVVSGCCWAHGTCIHKENSPRVPAASLRLQ